jgi:hypothetical protein
MPEAKLDAKLKVAAQIDLAAVFTTLGGALTHADLGDVRFDAAGVLSIVGSAAPPDLAGVGTVTGTVSARLRVGVSAGLPGAEVPGGIARLANMIGSLGPVLPPVDLDPSTGFDALLARAGAVAGVGDRTPLAALFGLVPGISLPQATDRTGKAIGGLVELARVVAGLAATSAVSLRLVERADTLADRLDVEAARAAALRLGRLSADTALVTAIRTADPDDAQAVELLTGRLMEFLDAVLDVERRWALGMAGGEGALLALDLAGGAAGLELARLAMSRADLTAVAALAADIRALADPLLRLPLPVPADTSKDVVEQAFGLLDGLVATLQAWDPASLVAPVQRVGALALEPLTAVRRMIEAVSGTLASAVRALRQLVDEVDLTAVADAVTRALQPVVDTLDAIEQAIDAASEMLARVCANITTGLGKVADEVTDAAKQVREALGRVRGLLDDLHLADLTERLRTGLGSVSAGLASAQVTPYFDAAIEVIDTGADIIDAVPFTLLPTEVQQEVVDLGRPIKQLDLQSVEDVLRGELEDIRESLHADALHEIEDAFAAVLSFLASLDPEPPLAQLEAGPLQELRHTVEGIDPTSLLAPAQEALDGLRHLLDGVDLRATVLDPLADLFTPVLDALAELDPAQALRPVREALDGVRQAVLDALHLDAVTSAVTAFRDRAAAVLDRADPAALAALVDADVSARIAALPAGPPAGPFGALLASLGQAGGLDVTEPSVGDALAWIAGREDGAAAVRGRLNHVADQVAAVRDGVTSLDPAPLTAAAAAQQRALAAALAVHAPTTRLRVALDPLLAGPPPGDLLGPLAENRRRYLAALEVDARVAATMTASGRSEVTTAASGVHVALLPLADIPARVRELLDALDVTGRELADAQSVRELVTALYELAGPVRLLPPLTQLLTVAREKLLALLDALLAPVLDAVGEVRATVDALDVQPVVDELTALHTQVTGEVQALAPENLLGGVLDAADGVVARLRGFDPLAPVADTAAAAREAALRVLDTARPTVVFADVVTLHHDVLALASGLDVAQLLRPVLDALDGIAAQLDDGFDRTGDALQRLQDAIPDQMQPSVLDVGVSGGFK